MCFELLLLSLHTLDSLNIPLRVSFEPYLLLPSRHTFSLPHRAARTASSYRLMLRHILRQITEETSGYLSAATVIWYGTHASVISDHHLKIEQLGVRKGRDDLR